MAFVEIRELSKSYWLHGKRIDVLRGLSLDIERGELLSLVGASGAGKSTFLHVLGTLDAPVAGTMRVDGEDVFALDDADLARFRNRTVGFVFQSHYLLPEFTALENVAMPALVQRVDHRPGELSGGEAQRVALARALVLEPPLLLADEPTGNLDPVTGEGIHQVLRDVNRDLGVTAVVVTHNEALARSMPRRLRLTGGKVEPA